MNVLYIKSNTNFKKFNDPEIEILDNNVDESCCLTIDEHRICEYFQFLNEGNNGSDCKYCSYDNCKLLFDEITPNYENYSDSYSIYISVKDIEKIYKIKDNKEEDTEIIRLKKVEIAYKKIVQTVKEYQKGGLSLKVDAGLLSLCEDKKGRLSIKK